MARLKRNKGSRRILQRKPFEHNEKKNPKWEFLIRTFDANSLTFMKSLGGFYPSIQPSRWMPGIYSHYLSSDIIPENLYNTWKFGFDTSIYTAVIHPDALKDLEFTVCKGMMYGTCMNPYLSEDIREHYQVMTSKTKSKRRPSMKKLSNWINSTLDPKQFESLPLMDNYNFDTGYSHGLRELFPRTHEVIFKKIPLEYICAVITSRADHVEAIKTYLNGVQVILVDEPSPDDKYYYRDTIVPIMTQLYSSI
jgi:hypothetical protein